MRKFISMFMVMMLTVVTLVACSGEKEEQGTTGEKSFKVGMMIDSGTIDDKSFNQGGDGVMMLNEIDSGER